MTITICCDSMYDILNNQGIRLDIKNSKISILLKDFNWFEIGYCPYCGLKIDIIKIKID